MISYFKKEKNNDTWFRVTAFEYLQINFVKLVLPANSWKTQEWTIFLMATKKSVRKWKHA